jgi:hypothetical protein
MDTWDWVVILIEVALYSACIHILATKAFPENTLPAGVCMAVLFTAIYANVRFKS